MVRLGLCCIFKKETIRFRTTTARALSGMPRGAQLLRLSGICRENAAVLLLALESLGRLGIRAFRITSPLFPLFTHPEVGYRLEDLPEGEKIRRLLRKVKRSAVTRGIRLSLHPDQFVVLSSPRKEVVENTLRELEYHGQLASLVGADVISVHGGGAYGNRGEAQERFAGSFRRLSKRVRGRIAVENDERTYTVRDLLPLCRRTGIPLVYDVHHHRCNPDGLRIEEATVEALATWEGSGREPLFHVSSPKNGWRSEDPRPHADYIDPADFPPGWRELDITVDVEAKAKELAVLKLAAALGKDEKRTP
jgi:UV DNA damage endonuclease